MKQEDLKVSKPDSRHETQDRDNMRFCSSELDTNRNLRVVNPIQDETL